MNILSDEFFRLLRSCFPAAEHDDLCVEGCNSRTVLALFLAGIRKRNGPRRDVVNFVTQSLEQIPLDVGWFSISPLRALCRQVTVPIVEEVGVSTTVGQVKVRWPFKQRSIEFGLRKRREENMSVRMRSYDETKNVIHLNIMRRSRLVPGERIQTE